MGGELDMRNTDSSQDAIHVTTVEVGRQAAVIVLRGVIRGRAVEQLREQLITAIEAGVRELFLDLSEVESIGSPVHNLVAAASMTLADRGGVMLTWSRKYTHGEPTYLMADIRDRALAELMPDATGAPEGCRESP
jgi:anti-anti-sigma regulatory factor